MFILTGNIGNYIKLNGRKYSYFAGNDYLGLANHQLLKKHAISSIKKYGINFSASRRTTGTSELHLRLEKLLSAFKNEEDTIIFPSGYLGNRILLHTLRDKYSVVFMDGSVHPSILDGIPSNVIKTHYFNHCDPNHLEDLLKKNNNHRPLIITDGIFALTGEIAPLDRIYSLSQKYNALLVVDDSHATGVLGQNGRGTPEHFQLNDEENIFQSETMSKALGAYGGFISASKEFISEIRGKSSIYIGSTALPPAIVAAGCASIKILKKHPEMRSRLFKNARRMRDGIKLMSFLTTSDDTPIVPLFFNSRENAEKVSSFLKENYIIAPYINYPVKIDKFLVRITVSAIHTDDQIDKLLELLNTWRERNGIN